MLTLTSEYVLRAVIYLARHAESCPIPSRTVAHAVGIPPSYLGQVLGKLVRVGVLVASPSTGGGFRLARASTDIRLLDVIAPFEAADANRQCCPFGKKECDRDDPCAAHSAWRTIRDAHYAFLARTLVDQIALAPLRRARKKKGRR